MPAISGITMESIPKYFDDVQLMKEGNVFLLPDYEEVK
jgi:hypothetical protein